jgi:hypothetical protein
MELASAGEDAHRERETLVAETRDSARAIDLRKMILDYFVPPDDRDGIVKRTVLSPETDEWCLQPLSQQAKDVKQGPQKTSDALFYRPISQFALRRIMEGDTLPRWRPDNILSLPLLTIERRVQTLGL